jgi:hypothetical protein
VSKAAILREAILKVVREHARTGMLPTSARFIYYELIAREIVSKVRTGARRTDQDMLDQLTILREREEIPWNWIEDETRELSDYTGYETLKEAALASLEYARLDAWEGRPPLSSQKAARLPVCFVRSSRSMRRKPQRARFRRAAVALYYQSVSFLLSVCLLRRPRPRHPTGSATHP